MNTSEVNIRNAAWFESLSKELSTTQLTHAIAKIEAMRNCDLSKPETSMSKPKTPNRVASGAGLGALVGKWRKNATEAREWGEKANSVAEKSAARERAETLDECAAAVERIGDEIHD